jgi:N6-L-threonylcarbamoyladenine synthase
MADYPTVLGLETSCDETAAAVVVAGKDVRSNVVASQVELHRKFGGVVPEIASRAHLECFHRIIDEALAKAGSRAEDIDAIAVTNRPGLVGALLVGVTAAKTLAWAWNKPYIAIDHVQAHAASGAIGLDRAPWPAVALIVSGGHTALYRVDDYDAISLLGCTTDDASGEAFDKVALILGLSYPGGPEIEKLAREGNPKAYDFPRTLLRRDSLDFSFSGLKTAVLYAVHGQGRTDGGLEKFSRAQLADLAASFQQAVVDVLVTKTMRAVARTGVSNVVLGGGVAANKALRGAIEQACLKRNVGFYAPAMAYCIDNGAMIAALGYHLLKRGQRSDWSVDVGTRATV